ncbi:MAG: PHP domain-containing protein [Roseiflexaceae bacterium]
MRVDLQIHSDALPHHSSWRTGTLIPALRVAGISVFAITDHNTVAGVDAMRRAADQAGLACIAACEIDCTHNGKLWHALLYGIDPTHPDILELCASVDARNVLDARHILRQLTRRGYHMPYDVDSDGTLRSTGRHPNVAELAKAFAGHNVLPERVDADDEMAGMRIFLAEKLYNPHHIADVIGVAHNTGGVAVLAHPGRSKGVYAIPADAADIASMVGVGLDGLEVFYPAHSDAQTAFLQAQAQQHNLLISGGSDSHHPDQPLAQWDATPMLPLLRRCGLRI